MGPPLGRTSSTWRKLTQSGVSHGARPSSPILRSATAASSITSGSAAAAAAASSSSQSLDDDEP
eukprot:5218784-Prymnesium_polylepis.1